jgi:hypothetical protein
VFARHLGPDQLLSVGICSVIIVHAAIVLAVPVPVGAAARARMFFDALYFKQSRVVFQHIRAGEGSRSEADVFSETFSALLRFAGRNPISHVA